MVDGENGATGFAQQSVAQLKLRLGSKLYNAFGAQFMIAHAGKLVIMIDVIESIIWQVPSMQQPHTT